MEVTHNPLYHRTKKYIEIEDSLDVLEKAIANSEIGVSEQATETEATETEVDHVEVDTYWNNLHTYLFGERGT